jgi:insulysin
MRLVALVALVACTPKQPAVEATTPPAPAPIEVVKSPIDARSYAFVELDNGIRALLISDPDTDMAAASLAVHVGHYADPPDRQGLAHFLEHMLFMGTDRYPDVDGYRKFVKAHGGSTNASTSAEETTYHFEIEHDALKPAFDQFARFFVAPLLDPIYVERERNAVNAEYTLKIQDNGRRARQVRKATTNPEHPESKFSVGNLETLGDREGDLVYEDLRALYAAEYRPDRMTVSILGREPVETLREWVVTGLGEVKGSPADASPRPPPFRPDQLGVRIDVVSLDERRELELQIPVPPEQPLWPNRPHSYVMTLLGHEGDGTLFARLKEAGWIERLAAGITDSADDYDLLSIDIRLTEGGFAHIDEIVAACFHTIRTIEASGVEAFRHDELRTIAELGFRFVEEAQPADAVRGAVYALREYPPQHVLDYWAVYGEFEPDLVHTTLAAIRPDNLRLVVTAPELETDQKEPLYDVPYAIRPLTEAEKMLYVAGTSFDITLPAPNPYLPESTDLVAGGEDPKLPVKISAEAAPLEVWHLHDTEFGAPRAYGGLQVWSLLPRKDQKALILAALYERVQNDALQSFRYPLDLAGLGFGVSVDDRGMYLRFWGFDEGQERMLRDLCARLTTFEVDPERFDLERDELVRRWKNLKRERPLSQTWWAAGEALDPFGFDRQAAIPIAEALTAADLQAFVTSFWASATTGQLLVHGNQTADEALAMATLIEDTLLNGKGTSARPVATVRRFPKSGDVVRDVTIDHDDSTLLVLYQGEGADAPTRAKWVLLGQLLETPFFTELRTQQQLGYSVSAGFRRWDVVPGLQLSIQSAVHGPATLLERVDTFLASETGDIAAMTDEDFATIRSGLVAGLLEDDTQLYRRTERFMSNLNDGITTFDWREQVAAEVEKLDRATMAAFAAQVLEPGTGRLIVRSVGRKHTAEGGKPGCADTACVVKKLAKEPFVRAL